MAKRIRTLVVLMGLIASLLLLGGASAEAIDQWRADNTPTVEATDHWRVYQTRSAAEVCGGEPLRFTIHVVKWYGDTACFTGMDDLVPSALLVQSVSTNCHFGGVGHDGQNVSAGFCFPAGQAFNCDIYIDTTGNPFACMGAGGCYVTNTAYWFWQAGGPSSVAQSEAVWVHNCAGGYDNAEP